MEIRKPPRNKKLLTVYGSAIDGGQASADPKKQEKDTKSPGGIKFFVGKSRHLHSFLVAGQIPFR